MQPSTVSLDFSKVIRDQIPVIRIHCCHLSASRVPYSCGYGQRSSALLQSIRGESSCQRSSCLTTSTVQRDTRTARCLGAVRHRLGRWRRLPCRLSRNEYYRIMEHHCRLPTVLQNHFIRLSAARQPLRIAEPHHSCGLLRARIQLPLS